MDTKQQAGDSPAVNFRLLEPAQRVVMGMVAAVGIATAGYFVFVPLSDARALALAHRHDAGSSGFARTEQQFAKAPAARSGANAGEALVAGALAAKREANPQGRNPT